MTDLCIEAGEYERCLNIIEQRKDSYADPTVRIESATRLKSAMAEGTLVSRLNGRFVAPKARALETALIAIMAKDEQDILPHALRHAYDVGFRNYAVADNLSSDGTAKAIEDFASSFTDCRVIRTFDPIEGYFQAEKTFALVEYAVRMFQASGVQIDWVFPHDADEFLFTGSDQIDLFSLIARADTDMKSIIAFQLRNFGSAEPVTLETYDSVFDCFNFHVGPKGRTVLKVGFRFHHGVKMWMGNHFVSNVAKSEHEVLVAAESGVFIAHFPYRTVPQIVRKITNGYKALASAGNINGGGHWREHFRCYEAEGDNYALRWLKAYNKGMMDR